jgi:cellobiose phosphorylase
MALVGAELSGYDTSWEAFFGPYDSYHNPLTIENGACQNSDAYGDNACGAMQTGLSLDPGESKEILILLGMRRQKPSE